MYSDAHMKKFVFDLLLSHILARAKKARELLQVTSLTTHLLMELLVRTTRGAKDQVSIQCVWAVGFKG